MDGIYLFVRIVDWWACQLHHIHILSDVQWTWFFTRYISSTPYILPQKLKGSELSLKKYSIININFILKKKTLDQPVTYKDEESPQSADSNHFHP